MAPEKTCLIKRNNCDKTLNFARTASDMHVGNGGSNEYPAKRDMLNLESVNTYDRSRTRSVAKAILVNRAKTQCTLPASASLIISFQPFTSKPRSGTPISPATHSKRLVESGRARLWYSTFACAGCCRWPVLNGLNLCPFQARATTCPFGRMDDLRGHHQFQPYRAPAGRYIARHKHH